MRRDHLIYGAFYDCYNAGKLIGEARWVALWEGQTSRDLFVIQIAPGQYEIITADEWELSDSNRNEY